MDSSGARIFERGQEGLQLTSEDLKRIKKSDFWGSLDSPNFSETLNSFSVMMSELIRAYPGSTALELIAALKVAEGPNANRARHLGNYLEKFRVSYTNPERRNFFDLEYEIFCLRTLSHTQCYDDTYRLKNGDMISAYLFADLSPGYTASGQESPKERVLAKYIRAEKARLEAELERVQEMQSPQLQEHLLHGFPRSGSTEAYRTYVKEILKFMPSDLLLKDLLLSLDDDEKLRAVQSYCQAQGWRFEALSLGVFSTLLGEMETQNPARRREVSYWGQPVAEERKGFKAWLVSLLRL